MLHDLAVNNGLHDIAQACLPGEKILASLEIGSGIECEHRTDKYQPMLFDDPFAIEQVSDIHQPRARGNDHDFVLGQRTRLLKPGLTEDDRSTPHDEHKE